MVPFSAFIHLFHDENMKTLGFVFFPRGMLSATPVLPDRRRLWELLENRKSKIVLSGDVEFLNPCVFAFYSLLCRIVPSPEDCFRAGIRELAFSGLEFLFRLGRA